MTVIDQAVRPAVQPSAARTSGHTSEVTAHRRGEGRDAYLLRLSLDLQLDALLLVLGASAAGPDESGIPWRRWLDEDVELAWELTATARSARASLPATLGTALADEDGEGVNADLLARYESMCRLLEDLIAADPEPRDSRADTTVDLSASPTAASPATEPTPPAWHAHVRAALDRCRARVEELRVHSRTSSRAAAAAAGLTSPVRPPSTPHASAHADRARRGSFLPGELLG